MEAGNEETGPSEDRRMGLNHHASRIRDGERKKVAKSMNQGDEKSRYSVMRARTINRHRWMRRES